MKNVKIKFWWTPCEDYGIPNNNYNDEWDSVVVEPPYTFADYLSDNDINFEREGDKYYVIDRDDQRTGECYFVFAEEETDEEI